MTTFDLVILVILIIGFVKGVFKGLIVEVASVLSLIVGIYCAIHFSDNVGRFLAEKVSWDQKYITLVSFLITFTIIVVVITLFGKLFTKLASFASLGIVNKLVGGVFGSLKFALIISVVLLVFSKLNSIVPLLSPEKKEASILYEPIKNLAPTLFPSFVKIIKDDPIELEKTGNN